MELSVPLRQQAAAQWVVLHRAPLPGLQSLHTSLIPSSLLAWAAVQESRWPYLWKSWDKACLYP